MRELATAVRMGAWADEQKWEKFMKPKPQPKRSGSRQAAGKPNPMAAILRMDQDISRALNGKR